MKVSRELDYVPMSAADVLAVIRDSYRFSEELDPESELGVDLTFASTVAEWRNACDLVSTRELGRALNAWFGVNASDAEWRAVLEPPQHATLGSVAALVASKGAVRPVAPPARLAGGECTAAGYFLAMRSLLQEAGVEASRLQPSTSLASLSADTIFELIKVMGRLAPGVMPVPRQPATAADRIIAWFMLLSLLALAFAGLIDIPWYPSACLLGLLLGVSGIIAKSRLFPSRLVFAENATLGDLARAIA